MSNRIAGVAYLKVNGRQVALSGKWTTNLSINGKREAIVGQDGVHGYKEMPTAPKFSGDACYTRDASIEELRNIDDATITLELANGKIHLLRNAWCSDEIELNTEDASFKLTFEGISGEESKGSGS